MNIIHVTTKEQLNLLYDQSALTWEGLTTDVENLNAVENWLKEHRAILDGKEPTFHIITGELMNVYCCLTGTNAYSNDLTLVSVTDINQAKVTIPRFESGARWFDDIVDNNLRREK